MVADSDAQHRFTVLFEATYGRVLAYVSRRVPAARADDLVAHVYLTAWLDQVTVAVGVPGGLARGLCPQAS